MKYNVIFNRVNQIKIFILLLVVTFTIYQCDLPTDRDEEEDLIETYERLLTAHQWKLIRTEDYFGGNDLIDEYQNTNNHEEFCEQDNYWVFNKDYTYEVNNGTTLCEIDDPTIDDWGDWDFDEYEDFIMLTTSSDKDYYYVFEYEVIQLSSDRMILETGGCVDVTNPDEDGLCITMTFTTF